MKVWFDVLTPKQLLFFEPMIKRIKKNHTVLCTSRDYRQVTQLAKIRDLKLKIIGKHGGTKRHDKLNASLHRSKSLSLRIKQFSPDITVSFCSPEAARVSYGLGISHICFSDSPHATAVMRLVIPLVQKLLIPWIIPKKEFTKFGMDNKDIISYRAIDAAIIAKRKISKNNKTRSKKNVRKIILVRVEEEYASYSTKRRPAIPIIKEILKNFSNEEIVVMGRYSSQVKHLEQVFGKKIRVLNKVVDSKKLLENTDVFIGSGGTMTAESALLGIPTISYNAVPNIIEAYLVRKKLVIRKTNPKQIANSIEKILRSSNLGIKKRSKKMMNSMEDPYLTLVKTMKSV
ncbi:MAG: lipid-A-disaccharide synthase [Thaumarchaeota archaeon]|nr:lipid-A-disaccharide synthase [Nitrososphaerota archaeon]